MPFNTYTDVSAFVNTIFEDALMVVRDQNVLTTLVKGFSDRQGMALRKLSTYGTATLNSILETDDLVSQAFTPSVLSTLTPAEAGAQFLLTDQRLESDPFEVRDDASLELGTTTATKMEIDIASDFSSLTGGTVGAAGTVITWGHFFAMLTRLRAQNAPRPWYFVCRPEHWGQLGKAVAPGATVTNAPNFQDKVLLDFYVGTVSGVQIFTSTNISVDANDDAYCAMFSPMAMAIDIRRAPRLEPERDASRRAWELNMTTVYAHGIWRPKFGIQGLFDAIAPTS